MVNGKPTYLDGLMQAAVQAARQDCSSERPQAKGVQLPLEGVPHAVRSRNTGDETSAALYEGAAGLKWRWVQDETSIASSVASSKASPHLDPDQDIVIQCYTKFVRKTPYMFALTVEHIHLIPTRKALQTLHELGLIAAD
jgi:hypothetical protein